MPSSGLSHLEILGKNNSRFLDSASLRSKRRHLEPIRLSLRVNSAERYRISREKQFRRDSPMSSLVLVETVFIEAVFIDQRSYIENKV